MWGPWFIGPLSVLVQFYADLYMKTDFEGTILELKDDLNFPKIQTYDFIVVGAGPAGCLLAGKLSEKFNVLLIEAGGGSVPAVELALYRNYITNEPRFHHLFESVPQFNFSQADPDFGVVKVRTGRIMGGGGALNSGIYNRGSPHDYDKYSELTGDESWSYERVLPHFKSFENYVGELVNETEREAYYGSTGPITVQMQNLSILPAWREAGTELGFDWIDPNGGKQTGFGPAAKNFFNGERKNSYFGYIRDAEGTRSSLTIHKHSTVEQILIDEAGTAYGVRYLRHGIPSIAHVTKEVLISCGALSSPILLIKSGIGPRDVLAEAGIPLIKDLPVGKTLHEHVASRLFLKITTPDPAIFPQMSESEVKAEFDSFNRSPREGAFTTMDTTTDCVAFMASSRAVQDGEGDWSDYQLVFYYQGREPWSNLGQTARVNIILNRAKSYGEVGFNATAYRAGERDIAKLALIDYRCLEDPGDVQVLIEGMEMMLKILLETKPFQAFGVEYDNITTPEVCAHLPFRSDDFWKCFLTQKAYIYQHPVGTCKMSGNNDPTGVVDSKLRVFGIQGLRVVDASVLPFTPNSNIHGAILLTAEKTAAEILEEYEGEGGNGGGGKRVGVSIQVLFMMGMISYYF